MADQNANVNLQDVIIVKKKYLVAQNKREERRKWKLRHIPQNTEDISDAKNKHSAAKDERDMADYQNDLEEDQAMRREVNLYVKKDKQKEHLRQLLNRQKARKANAESDGKGAFGALEGDETTVTGGKDADDEEGDDDDEGSECPDVDLAELIDGLNLSDDEDEEGENGGENTKMGDVADDESDISDAVFD